MPQFTGSLKKDNQTIAADISGSYETDRKGQWEGVIVYPVGSLVDSGNYTLELDSGEQGDILIDNELESSDSDLGQAHFLSDGAPPM